MKEFRKLREELIDALGTIDQLEGKNYRILQTVTDIIRQNPDSDVALQLYREVLVPNGINSGNTVF
jgi:hypothetical protein